MFIHERPEWPNFHWDGRRLSDLLADVRHRQGRLLGRMDALGFGPREEAALRTLTEDVVKTSEIEGEKLNPDQVRSSIARRLGMETGALARADRNVEGVVEMMLDATRNHAEPLTEERLFSWHAALFPTGRSGMAKIAVGAWRDDRNGPMTVVSGPISREKVHFVAPSASRVEDEMRVFLRWVDAGSGVDPVLRAALGHLWCVTIHPFDDGNGRIARAVADLLLARAEQSPQRFYSMSSQIRVERSRYYEILEQTQRGSLDVTPWMEWFLGCMGRAIDGAGSTLGAVLAKARFWERHRHATLNGRQRVVLNRLLDGFEGRLTTSKYAVLAKCSQDTAGRDVAALLAQGILARGPSGGRSTAYALVLDPA